VGVGDGVALVLALGLPPAVGAAATVCGFASGLPIATVTVALAAVTASSPVTVSATTTARGSFRATGSCPGPASEAASVRSGSGSAAGSGTDSGTASGALIGALSGAFSGADKGLPQKERNARRSPAGARFRPRQSRLSRVSAEL
jgi:hypothetical protein